MMPKSCIKMKLILTSFLSSLAMIFGLTTFSLQSAVQIAALDIVGSFIGTSMCLMVLRVRISRGRRHFNLNDDSTLQFRPEVSIQLEMNDVQSSNVLKAVSASSIAEMDTNNGQGDEYGDV